MPKNLLVIVHAPSENTQRMADAVLSGAYSVNAEAEDVSVHINVLSATKTQSTDILAADAIVIGTTENLGYMAGLTKDLFDRTYNDCLDQTQGKPFTFYIRAGHDGTGTRRALETITTGLRWRQVYEPLICKGDFKESFIDDCKELGMTMAASLESGII